MKSYFWTKSGARLKQIQSIDEANDYNWVFIPAPGLGSESLYDLVNLLTPYIKSNIWVVDYPNDGSNLSPYFSCANWNYAILEVANYLDSPILVSHSTGAMLLQSIPELEEIAEGFIWICSAPNMSWKPNFEATLQQYLTQEIEDNITSYNTNPSDHGLRKLLISMLKFSFNSESLLRGIEMVKKLPINYKVAGWFDQNFDPYYSAKFIPQHIPCLILGGEYDKIIPVSIYENDPRYCRQNIFIKSIPQASHYPWFENAEALIQHINEFIKVLSIK